MWREFVVKPSESWRLDSPGACNLPGAARMQQADQAKCYQPSHLSAQPSPRAESTDISPSASAGWCLCWLLCPGILYSGSLHAPGRPEKYQCNSKWAALSQRWTQCCWPELVFWLFLNLPIHECLFLAVSLAGSPLQQPPPLPSDAFQSYLGKQSVVIRNAHVLLPGVTEGCSVALGILTIATTSIDRIWYSLNRLFVYLSGGESRLQPELKHCQLNNAGLPS